MERHDSSTLKLSEAFAQRHFKGSVFFSLIELELLKSLPSEYKLIFKDFDDYSLFHIMLSTSTVKALERTKKPLEFDILLLEKYPLMSPRIETSSSFGSPSLADGRDLLEEILGRKWTPTTTLLEVILLLPPFITRYIEESRRKETKNRIYGKFYIGEKYDINDWMTMSTSAVYQCKEFLEEDLPPKHFYMVISESTFLLLETEGKWQNMCTLVLYATLYALNKIERDLDTPNKVTFHWKTQKLKVSPHLP
eukprot:TRINITY_DN9446_c0_g2_i1.p1 TRINITY_DN9446_c0_g2~~TRINITY_DN9446_c0_g2_i1.p1  ORF type:complete len:251 (+),score=74.62 TRINITY_DN9446_c0_g2_i1:155-907(+)